MGSYYYKGYKINGEYSKVYWSKKGKEQYCKQFVCLDTETSHNHNDDLPECWVYQWAFTFNKCIYYGRKPSDLVKKLNDLMAFYDINEQNHLIAFVHNLPYDFSYLALFFREAWGEPVNILASEAHKPFSIQYASGIEFRCSYKLSNDSLERWGNKLGVKHPKIIGAIDYNDIKYQDTPLPRNDWRYMFTDCICLDECLIKQMDIYGDKLITMPLTSTGYPRRELYRAYNGHGHHGSKKNKEREKFKDTRLEVDSYIAYWEEFSGGITHGNRYYKGKTLKAKDFKKSIRHRDFRSHYPTQQQRKMPMTKPVKFTGRTTVEYLAKYANDYAILCHVVLEDVRLKHKTITLPYLQTSHVMKHHSKGIRVLDDNGRIIQFLGQTDLWLDYNELLLILKQYDYTYILISETYASRLAPLPPWMVETINHHFKLKSDLSKKLKDAKAEHADKDIILKLSLDLMKSKNMLNGIYGVSATNPIRQTIEIKGNMWETKPASEDEIGEKLNKYYKSYKHCMRYPWGCYTTILARLQLLEVYEIIGEENFIYADTDSMFYFSTPELEQKLDDYNKRCYDWAIENNAYITTEAGEIINYNAFTDEGEDIIEFRFLHSKCYAYVTNDGELHCTIAGVKAFDKETKTYREDELATIDELKAGKVFTKCGGTTSLYLPNKNKLYPLEICNTMGGQEWAGGCIINRTTKTLTSTEWSESEQAFSVSYE